MLIQKSWNFTKRKVVYVEPFYIKLEFREIFYLVNISY